MIRLKGRLAIKNIKFDPFTFFQNGKIVIPHKTVKNIITWRLDIDISFHSKYSTSTRPKTFWKPCILYTFIQRYRINNPTHFFNALFLSLIPYLRKFKKEI